MIMLFFVCCFLVFYLALFCFCCARMAAPDMTNNVIIKDGILGITSHHGMHGNYNPHTKLENLIVKGFETDDIQFTCDIELVNVEVSPTSDYVRFNGMSHNKFLVLLLFFVCPFFPFFVFCVFCCFEIYFDCFVLLHQLPLVKFVDDIVLRVFFLLGVFGCLCILLFFFDVFFLFSFVLLLTRTTQQNR